MANQKHELPLQILAAAATGELPAVAGQTAENTTAAMPRRMTWAEIMADPEYNQCMQAVVQNRIKQAKDAEQRLDALTPALEQLSIRYGSADDEALVAAILDDAPNSPKRRSQLAQHLADLQQQAQAMAELFPDFDLERELSNPTFVRMTAPEVNLPVEDAYFATHRADLLSACMQVAAQKTAEKLAMAWQAGTARPREHGLSGQAAPVTDMSYKHASPKQRKAIKDRIYAGEKVVLR